MKYLYPLLLFVPVAVGAEYLHGPATLVFVASCLALLPLAAVLGRATEELAAKTSPRVGGLLNATLGNAAELIITTFALRAGLLDLVKASITGSILGNVLLVLGLSLLLGGLKNGTQQFDRTQAGVNGTMLLLAVIGLGVPSLFSHSIEMRGHAAVEYLSLGVAGLFMLLYVLWLVHGFSGQAPGQEDGLTPARGGACAASGPP